MSVELAAPTEQTGSLLRGEATLAPELHHPIGGETDAATDTRPINRRVLGLAWPVIGEHLLETLLGIVDTLLVAGLGMAAIAGVGSSLQIMFFILAALAALSVGSSILVAQAVGARDLSRANRLARQSLIWSVLISVPLALVGYGLATPIIGIFGMEPEVTRIGAEYLQVTMGTVVVLVALVIGGGVLRGAGDSRTPMVVTAIANVLNVVLAYGMIYGHWGLPALGAVGSAWATFIARGVALLLLLRVLWVGRNGVTIAGVGSWRPDWPVAWRILGLGIPAAVEQILMSTAFLVLTILVAHLGTATLAAQRIAMSAIHIGYLPGIGFGLAATALVAQSIGARKPHDAARVARIATLWATGLMCINAVIMLIFATPIMRLFTAEAEVVRIGATAMMVVAVMMPLECIGLVLAGALRGTGDTRYPLVAGSLGTWGAVALAWPALTYISDGLYMAWAPWLITLPITSFFIWRHFRRRIRAITMA